jgi:hypothetical protein
MLWSVTFKACVVEMDELDNNDIIWQKTGTHDNNWYSGYDQSCGV